MPIPDWAQSGPPLIAFLFVVVFSRAQGTYWLGRSVPAGLIRSGKRTGPLGKMAAWFQGPTPKKGAALLEQKGILLIPLCFLTVGLQTAILAGAGLTQMRWKRFTLAAIPGCVAWAFLYGLGMLAVWKAAVSTIAGSPWAWVALGAAVAIFFLIRQIRKVSSSKFEVEAAPEITPTSSSNAN